MVYYVTVSSQSYNMSHRLLLLLLGCWLSADPLHVFGDLLDGVREHPDNIGDPTVNDEGLLFVSVVYRHGQRTPVLTYPNDPYGRTDEYFPAGWGQLTHIGRRQLFELGTWLRRRYLGTVLRERYHRDDIRIESTDIDRTLQSAASNTAALFPPEGNDRWTEGASSIGTAWQPVPVHTVPLHLDDRLWFGRRCEAFEQLLREAHEQMIAHYHIHHKHLMAYVSRHSGSPLKTILDVWSVYDSLAVEAENNLTLPSWTERVFPHDGPLKRLNLAGYMLQTWTPQLARLKLGWLLREILERFEAKVTGKLVPARRSMWVYSAHDTTIVGLLNSMNMYNQQAVPYGSALMFELHRLNGTAHVQIVYRNSTADEPRPLAIPNCGALCPLDRMFELYAAVLPNRTWEEECEWPSKRSSAGQLVTGGRLVAVAIAVICGIFLQVL